MIKGLLYKITRKIALFPTAFQNNELIRNGWLIIGRGTYGQPIIDQYKGSESKVVIGNYTSIAPNVRIITGGIHPVHSISQFPFRSKLKLPGMYHDGNPYSNGDVLIGSDVWIGTNVTILSGVTIGDGAVIGAGSLITKSIPSFAIVNGIPGTVKKFRFTKEQIDSLLRIEWWNWPEERILKRVAELTSGDIETFINQN